MTIRVEDVERVLAALGGAAPYDTFADAVASRFRRALLAPDLPRSVEYGMSDDALAFSRAGDVILAAQNRYDCRVQRAPVETASEAWTRGRRLFKRGDFYGAMRAARDAATLPELELFVLTEPEPEQAEGPKSEQEKERATVSGYQDGASFIFDAPDEVPALWGRDDQILWARGEPLLVCGPAGVGKTTLIQQLILARLGLRAEVLGLAVERTASRVLYLTADRPRQARRSFRRMVSEADRETLAERLVVWQGPPPDDVAKDPAVLVRMLRECGADTIIIDSLKDVALELSKDETGSKVARAFQLVMAAGFDLVSLHHQRKGQNGTKPKRLEDVYGSTWIVNAAGSVIVLWGDAGDLVVEMIHLKQPAEVVGPWSVVHDHQAGHSFVYGEDQVDLCTLAAQHGDGITARDGARAITGKSEPTRNDVEKARRRLDKEVSAGRLVKVEGGRGGGAERNATRYLALEPNHALNHAA